LKEILLFARDPGGANTLIPVYDKLKESYQVSVYGKDVAVEWFKAEGLPCQDITLVCDGTYEAVYAFLAERRPSIVVTGTSLDDYTERYLWKSGEELGIKTYCILDQWINIGIRFSKYGYREAKAYEKDKTHDFLPHCIFVMDELTKELLEKDGIDKERIYVTGQPHFEVIRQKYEASAGCFDKDKYNVVYASEPVRQDYENNKDSVSYWGFHEGSNFEALYHCLLEFAKRSEKKLRLIVKPHPREDISRWEQVIKTKAGDREKVEVLLSLTEDKYALIKSADVVCGMSSMFLLEAAICEKTVVSIMLGLKRENPFILDRLGIIKSCLTEEELKMAVNKGLCKELEGQSFPYVKNGADNVISYINKEIEKEM
jgi:hypothetical protein